MKKLTILAGLCTMLFLGTQEASAQAQIQIGPRVGYDIDALESLFVGADARISVIGLPIQINPTFDYYFLDKDVFGDDKFYQVAVNGLYNFGFDNQLFTPYAGVGVAISRYSPDGGDGTTDVGANLIGGAAFGFGSLRPFVQAQLTLGGDAEPVGLVGGLLFNLGR